MTLFDWLFTGIAEAWPAIVIGGLLLAYLNRRRFLPSKPKLAPVDLDKPTIARVGKKAPPNIPVTPGIGKAWSSNSRVDYWQATPNEWRVLMGLHDDKVDKP